MNRESFLIHKQYFVLVLENPFNTVQGNSVCVMWESYGRRKHIAWKKWSF